MQLTSLYTERTTAGKIGIWVVGVLVALFIIGSLTPSDSDDDTTPEAASKSSSPSATATPTTAAPAKSSAAPKPKAKPKFDAKAYAAKAEKTFVAYNTRPIAESCDAEFTRWQCFYDDVTATSDIRLDINLSTPGDYSKGEIKDMSERARMAWFNSIGLDFPKVENIVTFVNGLDTGTTYRDDVYMLNR